MKSKLVNRFIISTFVTLYAIVSIISTIHVIDFFKLSNPEWLAVSLAIAFEIGAAASLASLIALKKMNRSLVWGLFIILTGMQMMGNTYYAFKNLHDIQSWVDLFGLTDSEPIFQKRMMAIISGAILPLVALGFIKSLVDYIRPDDEEPVASNQTGVNDQITDSVTVENPVIETPTVDVSKVWEKVKQLKSEGKLPEPTTEDIENEPTALAFTTNESLGNVYNEEQKRMLLEEIETKPTLAQYDDEAEKLKKLLGNELTQEDIQKYVERSRINNKEDNSENPHLIPGVRT